MNELNMPTAEQFDELNKNVKNLVQAIGGVPTAKRYGVKINKNDSNPESRIEYIHDAVGFAPAKMNFTTGQFDYGAWADIWFIKENYPAMIKFDGRENYRLNPNDYSKKLDGTASDVADVLYGGNAMSVIPLVWLKQYELDGYEYIIACQEKYDATYEAYAHTRADGSVADNIRLAMFKGADHETKLRSLSSLQPAHSKTSQVEIDRAKANGAGWDTRSWSHRNLINSLLSIISKNDNSQEKFGNGNLNYQSSIPLTFGVLETGSLNAYGQFKGYNDNVHQVKVFHMEGWWADQWERIQGLLNVNGNIKVKTKPPYNLTGVDFANTYLTPSGVSGGYIIKSKMTKSGRLPFLSGGTSATNQCDGLWFNNTITAVALVGGYCNSSLLCGSSCVSLDNSATLANWHFGAALSCEQPLVA